MNHIYRLCWNRTLRAWVPASELAKGKGAGSGRGSAMARVPLMLSLLSVSLGMSGLAWAGNAPTGGQIVSGSGAITQSGNVTTIQQNSQTLSLNWQSFDIGANQTVDFLQPGRDSIAINRILGNTASDIQGHLNANGQVWLINPNGVLFGKDAQVNVGGIVASTLELDQSTLGSDTVRFSGNGKGSVVNLGAITVTPGGYAALLGNTVSNQGVIRAQLGTVALAGGTAMTLTFADNHLMHLVVDANAVKSLVENRQLIVADGGQVLMTAGARNSLIDSAVNNTGVVQAQTVQDHNGTITLLGGMEAGTVNVAGTLDASAPQGGKGGFIETSGAHAHIADGSVITTKAAGGQSGTWLVDPADFTIAASGGDITATQLAANLASGNITLTSAQGTVNPNGSGNVNVNQAVTWGANTTLTLTASNNVVLNAAITNTGGGKTVLNAGNAFVNNAGSSALGGNWAIYSASPTASGEKLGGLTPGFYQYNAPIGTAAAAGATGNGVFYESAASISITGFNTGANGTPSKSYDGTSNLLVNELAYTLSGGGSGDILKSISGGYGQSDAGTNLGVSAPTASSAYTILNGTTPVYGYSVSGSATSSTGAINPATLTISIVGQGTNPLADSTSKVYDGTNTATLNQYNYQITGLAPGQSLTVNQPSQVGYGTISGNTINGTVDVGDTTTISAIFTSSNFIAGAGTKLSNYNLTGLTATGAGSITPAPVYLSGVIAKNKTYDASKNDPLDISNANIYGIVNNDDVKLDTSNGIGSFADANAGSGKAVTLSGFALTGNATKVADYNLILPTNLTASIAQAQLQVYGVTVGNKVYDGSTATTAGELNLGNATFTGTQGSDSLKLGQANVVGNFSQADVGNNLAVAVSGLTVENSDGSVNNNYVVSSVQGGTTSAPTALVANITPARLTIAFNPSVSPDKMYDGTDYATLNGGDFTVTGMVGSEQVAVSQAPATYAGSGAPNIGTYDVTAELQSSDLSFTNGAKAGNYIFNTAVTGTGSITPAPLKLVIDGDPSKVYDGNSSASLAASNFMLSGVIPGETIKLVGPFTGNYYNGSPSTPESNAGTLGVVAALSSGNYQFTASSGNPTGSLRNYILPTTALGYGTITPKSITGQITAGINGASKVYDGNTSITLVQNNIVFSGFVNGDGGTVTVPITGTFTTKDVGTQPLTALLNRSNVLFTCGGGGTACLSNYTYDGVAGDTLANANWNITAYGSGTIQQKDLYITLSGVTKQYDGNNTVLPLDNGNFAVYGYAGNNTSGTKDGGWVTGEGATINSTASFTYGSPDVARDGNGNVLSNIEVKGTLTSNNYTPNGNTQLSNYKLVYTIDQNVGQITPAPLYVTGVTAQNKIYDGNTGALIDIGNGQIAGLADRDKNSSAITLTIGTGTADSADGIAGSATGTLAPNGSGFTASGSPVSGTFHTSANVSSGTQAIDTTFTLGGSSAGNYTLTDPTLTASITPRPLDVTGITANSKTYDGTTAATFTFTTPTFSPASGTGSSVSGLLAQDQNNISLNQSSGKGTFDTANANMTPGANGPGSGSYLSPNGQPITVTASGFTLSGDAAGNYALSQPTGLSADIAQAPITLDLVGPIKKVYDGTTSITIPTGNNQTDGTSVGYQTSGWVSGQGATITQTHSASYANADATVDGNGNPIGGGNGLVNVTASLVSSDWQPNGSTSLSNYALPSTVTKDVGVITPLVLSFTGTRVYDTTTHVNANDLVDAVTGSTTFAGLNGDSFTVSGTGTVSAKDVGTYGSSSNASGVTGAPSGTSQIGVDGLTLSAVSGNVNNYTLVGGTDTYTITPYHLQITGTAQDKIYDGTRTATVTGVTFASGSTPFAGDGVTVNSTATGQFATANANTDPSGNTLSGQPGTIAVTVTNGGVTLTNNAKGNYVVDPFTGTSADIKQRQVVITGTRQYDGTSVANSTAQWSFGAIAGNPNSGVVSGQTVKVTGKTPTDGLSSANVGSYADDGSQGNNTFNTTGLGLSSSNYAIAVGGGNKFTITPYQINLTGSSIYDGTGVAGTGNFGLSGGTFNANGQTVTIGGSYTLVGNNCSGTACVADANVISNGSGGGRAITQTATGTGVSTGGTGLGGLTLSNGTGDASNYVINSVQYTLNPVVLSFTGSKTYDGSSSFDASTIKSLTGGFVGTDEIAVSGGTGTLSSANAGNYGTGASGIKGTPTGTSQIGVGGLTLTATSGNANNYTLIGGADTYTIDKATINVVGVRQYTGNGTVAGSGSVTLINGTPTTCAVGNTCWGVSGSGVVSTDLANLTVTSGGSTVTSPGNVGTYTDNGGGFIDTGLALGGSAAGNYTLAATGNEFIITPYIISLSGTRTYDGKTDANANVFGNGNGTITGTNGEVLTLAGSGVLSGKDVNGGTAYTGTGASGQPTGGQGFNLGTLALGNGTSGNAGSASNYTLVGGADSLTLTPLAITVGTTASNKVYDGTATATVATPTSSGVLAGDTVNFTDTGATFASPNVAHDANGNVVAQTVTVSGIAASGADAGDYTFNTTATTTASITPYVLGFSGTRQYDGTANVNGSDLGTLSGVNGDQFTVNGTGTSYSANAGTYSATNPSGTPTSTQQIGVNGLILSNAGANTGTELAGNYMLAGTPTNGGTDTYTITQKVLNLTGTRTYDGTTNIYSDGTSGSSFDPITGGMNGDTFTLTGEGSTSGKDVNGGTAYTGTGASGQPTSGQGFNLGTLELVGTNANNYTLVGGTDSYTLTPATLTVVNTTVITKTYDGNTAATLSGATLAGVVGGDTVTLGNDTAGTFATPNAGTNIAVTTNGPMTIGGSDAGNYTLVQPTGLTGTVTQKVLNLTGSRTYDGTTNIYSDGTSGSSFDPITGGVNGDTFTLTGEGSTSGKGVNGGTAYTGTGASGQPTSGQGFNLGTLQLQGVGSTDANNYTLVGGTDSYVLTPATLTVANTTVDTKTYDGTTAATLKGATLAGVIGSDNVTLGNDTTGTFATPNAGTGIGVTASTMTIGGGDAGNYTLVQPSGLTGTITPVVLDLTGTRVYDGTTNAAAGLFGNNGVLTGVNGETLTLGGNGTLSTKNVGTQQPFASTGLSDYTLTGNGTALASNYTLAGGTDWVTITPLAITVNATGKDKTYDGNTAAGVTLGSSGVLAGDTVAFTDGSANFSSPNAGTSVSIAVTGITASGGDASNYSFNTAASTSANITPYVLDLTGQRVYDTTTNAYGSDFGTVGGLNGDTFTVSGTGAVSSKNVGNYNGLGGTSFNLGDLALVANGSALGSNYTLVGGTDQYTITPATLTVVGTTVGTKTYDGTTTATLSGSTLTGVLGGDTVTLGNDTTGTFNSPNAGTGIGVTTGMTLGGGDAGNYVIVQPTDVTGTINPYVLDLSGTRVYDGSTNAYANLFGNGGVLTGINGQAVVLSGTGQVGDKNVGTGKPFASLGSLTLSDGSNGGLAGNYTLVGGTDTLSITPKTLVVDATGTNKMYDGNTTDTVTLGSGGLVAGDSVQFGYGAANFANPNVGNNILVTVTGVQLSGADAGNYLLASPTVYTHADITGALSSAFGISNGTLASLDSVLGPTELATPYGLAPQVTVGAFTGNKKRLHHPVERNVSRRDFTSGLALKVIDGGLRVPVQAMP